MKQITLFLVSVFLLSLTASSFAAEDTMMMKEDTMMSHDKMSSSLVNVTAGKEIRGIITSDTATGHASMSYNNGEFSIHAEFSGLATPQGDDFYEGWAVQRSPFKFISTGKLEIKDGKYVNHFTSTTDYSSYDFYVLTLEPNDGDAAPADHIFEGELTSKMMMKEDTMMQKDEMEKSSAMMEKEKMMMAKKQSIKERIQAKVKNLSQKKIDLILERVALLRVKLAGLKISEAKKASYNDTLDIFVEVLQGDDMMMKDTMMQK